MKKRMVKPYVFIMLILTIMLFQSGTIKTEAYTEENQYNTFFSMDGEWVTENAWDSDGTAVKYSVEFWPGENEEKGTFVFGYQNNSEEYMNYWYGDYCVLSPADLIDEQYAGGQLCAYILYLPDSVRRGTFIAVQNGEKLTITEDGGDCFWPFTSNASETLEFNEYMVLDGDGSYVEPASTVQLLMTYEEISSWGYEFLHYTNGEFLVSASRKYDDADGEILKIGCFRNDEPIWGYVTECPFCTEVEITEAFIAGTVQEPMVAIFNSEYSMIMVDMFSGDIVWEINAGELCVGGSIQYDVAEDGTIFCGGYYDLGPTAISMNGEILWRAQPESSDIYWLSRIEVESGKLIVDYATGTEEGNDIVVYNLDGTQAWTDIRLFYP